MGLWTTWHAMTLIPTFVVFIGLAVLLGILFKNKSEKIKFIPLQVIAVAIVILEVIKQICSVKEGVYDMYSLPFHYCSLFLYILPLHAFWRTKGRGFINAITYATTASLFIFMVIMPAVVYSDTNIKEFFTGDFIDFHTVTFHALVCLYFFLMVAFKLYKFNLRRDVICVVTFIAGYVVLAATLAYTLEVNFHNLYRSNLLPVENIRAAMVESMGWLGSAIYVCIMFVLTIIFAYASYFAFFGFARLMEKIKAKKAA